MTPQEADKISAKIDDLLVKVNDYIEQLSISGHKVDIDVINKRGTTIGSNLIIKPYIICTVWRRIGDI